MNTKDHVHTIGLIRNEPAMQYEGKCVDDDCDATFIITDKELDDSNLTLADYIKDIL